MTEKAKDKLDTEMMSKWKQFVGIELLKGTERNIRHINEMIDMGHINKVYLNSKLSLWVFILFDGVYGVFDGYTWYEYIPRALAEFMGKDILNQLKGNDFEEIDGKFFLKSNNKFQSF